MSKEKATRGGYSASQVMQAHSPSVRMYTWTKYSSKEENNKSSLAGEKYDYENLRFVQIAVVPKVFFW